MAYSYNDGAKDARANARTYGIAVACHAIAAERQHVDYVRGYTDTLLVLVQVMP